MSVVSTHRSGRTHLNTAWFIVTANDTAIYNCRQSSHRFRCASLLKPLYMWAASHMTPYIEDRERWQDLAAKAIAISSNEATQTVWEDCGSDEIIAKIQALTGVRLKSDIKNASWGSLFVTAEEVAQAYGSMIVQNKLDSRVFHILDYMTQVPESQTFGLRHVVMEQLGVAESAIGIKCGWYIDEDSAHLRTHAVILINLTLEITVGVIILSATKINPDIIRHYLEAYASGDEIIDVHERYSGATLRSEAKLVLESLSKNSLLSQQLKNIQRQ